MSILKLKPIVALIALTAVAPMTTGSANAKAGTNIGILECTIEPGVGLIIGSSKDLSCQFNPDKGRSERYTGSISKLGLDIGVTNESYVKWLVVAPGSVDPGALAGTYAGASAEATVGLGVGANALVGGLEKSIALQPVSIQGQTGLNVAVGIAGLKLRRAE